MNASAEEPAGDEAPLPLGVDAATGLPLPTVDARAFEAFARREAGRRRSPEAAAENARQSRTFALMGDVSADELDQAGWGLVFASETDPAPWLDALAPLVGRRREQAGARFRIFEGEHGCRPGESASAWLTRHGASLNLVDPELGVPYYLALVGSPQQIPYAFQYTLDLYWAVGRLDFSAPEDLRHYADSVAAWEAAPHPDDTVRGSVLFATCHDFDRATRLLTRQLVGPLAQALGRRPDMAFHPVLAEAATKAALRDILRGRLTGGAPALLFTGTHGVSLPAEDPRQAGTQGAIVCQDWQGYGAIASDHWFGADDLPDDMNCHGMIYFCFACYGAGVPEFDDFARAEEPVRIAQASRTARLPQRLLAHPDGGALAVLGHVDRAWAYSFQNTRAAPQTQGFRDVIGSLMRGDRIGHATDRFNLRWAALSTELADLLRERQAGAMVPERELALRWAMRDDARNYVILGDPAVRMRA